MHEAVNLQHASSAHPPARVHHALTTCLVLDVLHGDGLHSGSTVAAKAGADAPGGGISLCFCRRGCAAPAQKAATLNALPQRKEPSQRKNRRIKKNSRNEIIRRIKKNSRHEIIRRHEKPVPTLRSSSAAPGRAKISKGIGITLPEASYGFRQSCRNRESVWPLQRPSPW